MGHDVLAFASPLMTPTKDSSAAIHAQIEQIDEKHEEGHSRLRSDIRDLAQRVEKLEESRSVYTRRLDKIEITPQEAAKLKFSPGVVLVIVTTLLSLAGGQWASTYGLRSDVRDILTRMAMQAEVDKGKDKVLEERARIQSDAISELKRLQQLNQYEIQGLKEAIMKRETR